MKKGNHKLYITSKNNSIKSIKTFKSKSEKQRWMSNNYTSYSWLEEHELSTEEKSY